MKIELDKTIKNNLDKIKKMINEDKEVMVIVNTSERIGMSFFF